VKILRKRQSSEPALPWTQRDPKASPLMVTGIWGGMRNPSEWVRIWNTDEAEREMVACAEDY